MNKKKYDKNLFICLHTPACTVYPDHTSKHLSFNSKAQYKISRNYIWKQWILKSIIKKRNVAQTKPI